MQIKLFIMALSFFAQSGMADSQTLSIDLLRETDSGMLHTAVRCKSECEIVQRLVGAKVFSTKVKRDMVQKALDQAFKSAPSREISSGRPPMNHVGGSPLHWRFYDGSRTVQGAFTMHPTEEAKEKERLALYQTVLRVEQWLDRSLARSSK